MADETPSGQTPTADGQAPPATPAPAAPAEPDTFDAEYVRKLRAENADARRKLRDAETKVTGFEAERLTETEKLQKLADTATTRLAELETALRTERTRAAIGAAATSAGIAPALAERLIEVEYDAAGLPTGVEAAVRALVAQHPNLVTTAGPLGSPANAARPQGAAGMFTTTQIADRAFYTANRDAIMAAMREGRITDG